MTFFSPSISPVSGALTLALGVLDFFLDETFDFDVLSIDFMGVRTVAVDALITLGTDLKVDFPFVEANVAAAATVAAVTAAVTVVAFFRASLGTRGCTSRAVDDAVPVPVPVPFLLLALADGGFDEAAATVRPLPLPLPLSVAAAGDVSPTTTGFNGFPVALSLFCFKSPAVIAAEDFFEMDFSLLSVFIATSAGIDAAPLTVAGATAPFFDVLATFDVTVAPSMPFAIDGVTAFATDEGFSTSLSDFNFNFPDLSAVLVAVSFTPVFTENALLFSGTDKSLPITFLTIAALTTTAAVLYPSLTVNSNPNFAVKMSPESGAVSRGRKWNLSLQVPG